MKQEGIEQQGIELDMVLTEGDNEEIIATVPFQGGTIDIRYVSREELKRITKQSTVTKYKKNQPIKTIDSDKNDKLLGRAAVRGWTGFTLKGKPFPFNEENLDKLILAWNEFALFVADACTDLQKLQEHRRAEAEKNSEATSGPGSTTQA